MTKIPQKNQDEKELLDITKFAKARAEKELVNFTENHGYMLDQMRDFQKNIERIKKSFDFKRMGEQLAIPLKQFSHLAENIQSVSHLFQVSVPTDLIKSITEIKSYPIQNNFVYTPKFEQSYNRFDTGITRFYEKVEYKIAEKFLQLEKSLDKKLESYKIKIVNEKNVYCGHCDYLLMKTKFIVYGEATMKCPGCKELIHIPRELRYGELK